MISFRQRPEDQVTYTLHATSQVMYGILSLYKHWYSEDQWHSILVISIWRLRHISMVYLVHGYDWHNTWIHHVYRSWPCFTSFVWIRSVLFAAIPLLLQVWSSHWGGLDLFLTFSMQVNPNSTSASPLILTQFFYNTFHPSTSLLTSCIRGHLL